ncbi:hypothetical protein [Chondromyces apiculatus]|uniref:Uncharacterized protein n=1 Tax=Chondromyces apiculatus DSM 436 TaxID=1192034 RepID=A0A017SZZ9_9BACT|nr:hypothetical protein [Chondromyces apiculatus]EYF01896.1 Hypothetical protein CAP_7664 [Chondromyces apiculatus DSM 436]
MLFEVDTDITGVTVCLLALAWVNIIDARRDQEVARELVQRCAAPAKRGFLYRNDLPGKDRWSTFVPLLRRTKSGRPIKADCEDQAAAHAAAFHLTEPHRVVEVAITHPGEGQLAHAYLVVDGHPFDPCVPNGMKQPPQSFYGSGTTARLRVFDPCLLFGLSCPNPFSSPLRST